MMRVFHGWPNWAEAAAELASQLPAHTVSALGGAYEFASAWHKDQTRPGGEPYPWHLLETLQIAVASGMRSEHVLTAALLHDVVEDTDCDIATIHSRFGEHVADLVRSLTKPTAAEGSKAAVRRAYLESLKTADDEAVAIKISDRYSNVQRLHTHPQAAKQRQYYCETVRHILPLADRFGWFRDLFAQWAAHYAYLGDQTGKN